MKRRTPAGIATGELTPRKRRRRIIESVLVAIGCVVLGDAVIGEQGWWAHERARQEAQTEMLQLNRARAETVRLRTEMQLLETDWPTIEDVARRELWLIKPGEKLFIIKDVPPRVSGKSQP